MTMEDS